jgi:hypothetical protein
MEQTAGSQGPTGPATADKRFYQRASFWLGPFTWGIGLLVAIALGIGWYILGGFPRDHDKYGEVAVPGQQVLALDDGDLRLYFENHATRSGDSTTIDDEPPGLDVRVTPAGGGEELEVEDVPSWIFGSTTDDRGHEPWGKVDVPSDADYLVATTSEGAGLKAKPVAAGGEAASPEPPTIDDGPAISVGATPWNPLDSRFLGAVLCGVAVMLVMLLFTLPFRLFVRD